MVKKERIRLMIGIVVNVAVFALSIYCLSFFIKYLLQGSKDNRFRYYTNISNLTVGLIALINAIVLLISVIKGKLIYPKALSIIKFVGICMTSLTFFTVLLVIAPLTGFFEMYKGMRFITHLVTPLLVVVSYFFFEEKTFFEWKYSLFGFIPPIIYSIVYSTCVFALKVWPDIYKINTYGFWYLVMIGVDLLGFAVAEGLYFATKALRKKLLK